MAELRACIVKGLVDRPTRRAESFREHVDGNIVHGHTLKDESLTRREVRVDGAVERSDQLVVLEPLECLRGLIGEPIPDRLVELNPSLAPGVASLAGRRLEDHELAGPRREPCGASIGVELGENRHERITRGLNAQVIHLLRRSHRQ